MVLLFEPTVPDDPSASHLPPLALWQSVYYLLPVGDVGPAGLLVALGLVAVGNRLGVQQSGAAVDLELLRGTSEE